MHRYAHRAAAPTFRARVRATAYPVREAAGNRLGLPGPPADKLPPFPAYEWFGLPPARCRVWKLLHECNYAQALERDVNMAHVRIAHRQLGEAERQAGRGSRTSTGRNSVPIVEAEPTRYGFRHATLYRPDEPVQQLRVAAFLLPCLLFLGPIQEHYVAMAFVPRDDSSNWHFTVRYNPRADVDAEAYAASRGLDRLAGDFRKAQNRDNAYREDRQAMQQTKFNGIDGVIVEDHALAEIQGAIVDRTRETLSATDAPCGAAGAAPALGARPGRRPGRAAARV